MGLPSLNFEIQKHPSSGLYRIREVNTGYWVVNSAGAYPYVEATSSQVATSGGDRWIGDMSASYAVNEGKVVPTTLARLNAICNQMREAGLNVQLASLSTRYVAIKLDRQYWANADGYPYVAPANSESTATNQSRPDTQVKDESGEPAEDDEGNIIQEITEDNSTNIDLSGMTVTLPDGTINVIDQLIYDESSKTYYIDSHDTVNNTVNNYYSWTYYINYTSITYIGQSEEYNKYYEVYYELPDGRDSADLTAEELEQLNLSIDVVPYGRSADDASIRSLYHFDGDTRDSSYWNYCTDFTWNTGASLTYMESGAFDGCLYLDEKEHDFTLTLPSSVTSGDFTLQFRYYQSYTAAPQTDSYISFGTTKLMQLDGANIKNGAGTTLADMPIGSWNELALLRASGTLYYYLNGVCIGSVADNTAYPETINFHFGSAQQTYKQIDELRFVNRLDSGYSSHPNLLGSGEQSEILRNWSYASGDVTFSNDALHIGSNSYVRYWLASPETYVGSTLTVSALLTDGEMLTCTAAITAITDSLTTYATAGYGNFRLQLCSLQGKLFCFMQSNGGNYSVSALKVEIGSESTLADNLAGGSAIHSFTPPENYTPTSVPYDTNLSLVLPDSAVAVADEYWSISSSKTNLLDIDFCTGLAPETLVSSSSFSGDVSTTLTPSMGIITDYAALTSLHNSSRLTRQSAATTYLGSAGTYWVGGLFSCLGVLPNSNVPISGSLPYGIYTLSVVLADGTIDSFTFDFSDYSGSAYQDYSWGRLGFYTSCINENVDRYAAWVYILPYSGSYIDLAYVELAAGSSTDLTAEWVTSVVEMDKDSFRTPTLAVRTDIAITSYQIGGPRPSLPRQGQVWALVESGYIRSLQIYNGQAWEGCDGRIWTGERWIPYSSYNVITLQDMYDVADASGNTYEYIYTESGFWAWWQRSWNAFTDKLFSALGSGGLGSGSSAPASVKEALSKALSSLIESAFGVVTEVLKALLSLVTQLLSFIFGFLTETVLGGIADFFSIFSDGSLFEAFQQTGEDGSTSIGLPSEISTAFSFVSGVILLLPDELRGILIFGVGFMVFLAVLKMVKE